MKSGRGSGCAGACDLTELEVSGGGLVGDLSSVGVGSVVSVECSESHHLAGPSSYECGSGGKWTPDPASSCTYGHYSLSDLIPR